MVATIHRIKRKQKSKLDWMCVVWDVPTVGRRRRQRRHIEPHRKYHIILMANDWNFCDSRMATARAAHRFYYARLWLKHKNAMDTSEAMPGEHPYNQPLSRCSKTCLLLLLQTLTVAWNLRFRPPAQQLKVATTIAACKFMCRISRNIRTVALYEQQIFLPYRRRQYATLNACCGIHHVQHDNRSAQTS